MNSLIVQMKPCNIPANELSNVVSNHYFLIKLLCFEIHRKSVGQILSSHKWIIMLKLMMLDNYKVNTSSQTFITR